MKIMSNMAPYGQRAISTFIGGNHDKTRQNMLLFICEDEAKEKKAMPANDLIMLIKLCIRCKKLISDLTFIHYCIHDLLKDLPITLMNMSYRANVVRGSSILSK